MFEFITEPIIAWFGLPSVSVLLLIIIILILIFKD